MQPVFLDVSVSIWTYGWSEAVGIAALAIGATGLILLIVFTSVPILRNWTWVVAFVVAIAALVVVITTTVWIVSAPKKDAEPYLNQGIIVGPWLLLAGGIVTLIFGVLEGVTGVIHMVRRRRASEG